MDSIICTSHAKINLFLEIKGKRDDGYHELCTLFQEVSVADKITLKKNDEDYSILKCDDVMVPFGNRNLCIKAYDVMRRDTPLTDTVEIHVEKKIPLGSGLGGGSSNAASVITGLNQLYEMGLDKETLAKIGAQIGSDVPFFVYGGTAMGRGRGNEISPLPSWPKPLWLVLIMPMVRISSGNAYQWVKGYRGEREPDEDELASKIQDGDMDYIAALMYNAFEPIVLEKHPELADYRRELEDAGCLKVMMTGSGSAFYGLCENESAARAIADSLADHDDLKFVAALHTV